MDLLNRRAKYYYLSFLKHDFRASITVFFVALPLCLGISLASNAPVYAGLIAGILGGLVVSIISKSELSVSGPAAGLTAISAAAISDLVKLKSPTIFDHSTEIFFFSVPTAFILTMIFLKFFMIINQKHIASTYN